MADKSIVGDLINFRGLVYSPINENGVIFLFGKVADDLNMYIEEIKPGFPDCIGRRFVGKGWERVSIEFEYQSKNFIQHGHDPDKCDLIICWEHNWKDCPIEVIELKTEISSFENYSIKKPIENETSITDESLDSYFKNKDSVNKLRGWFDAIFEGIEKNNPEVWMKIGKKYIGWYSPQRAFASIRVKKTQINIKCFCGSSLIEGTQITNEKLSPRWCRFVIKKESDIKVALTILEESIKRINNALKAGESTGYFSGGKGTVSEMESQEEDDDEDLS